VTGAACRLAGKPAPLVIGLRSALDRYLPFDDLQAIMPFRAATASIKQARRFAHPALLCPITHLSSTP